MEYLPYFWVIALAFVVLAFMRLMYLDMTGRITVESTWRDLKKHSQSDFWIQVMCIVSVVLCIGTLIAAAIAK